MREFNLSCPHNDNKVCERCHSIKAQDGWEFRGCFAPPNKGKFVADVKECPLKMSGNQGGKQP